MEEFGVAIKIFSERKRFPCDLSKHTFDGAGRMGNCPSRIRFWPLRKSSPSRLGVARRGRSAGFDEDRIRLADRALERAIATLNDLAIGGLPSDARVDEEPIYVSFESGCKGSAFRGDTNLLVLTHQFPMESFDNVVNPVPGARHYPLPHRDEVRWRLGQQGRHTRSR